MSHLESQPPHPPQPGTPLAELAEEELLARIFPLFAPGPQDLVGPGDDAAVVRTPSGSVIATTDSMVRGRDWLDEWSSAREVGRKLVTQNCADIAAMGGVATTLLVSLVADPHSTTVEWAVDFASGVAEGAAEAGASVAGGDLSSAPEGTLLVSITALGDLRGRAPVLRSGARVGDVVALAGPLGTSAAGLQLLESGTTSGGAGDLVGALLAAHRSPRSPLECGPQASGAGATAMIDISDGLLRDADRVARASRVRLALSGAVLDGYAARLAPAVGPELARECVLAGGEEHSLLATFAPGATLPEGWVRLGDVVAGAGVTIDGEMVGPRGWDHFRA